MKIPSTFHPHRASRAGLTLVELVVVLVVLIALAGILVPMLPGMIGRSHSGAGSTNIREIAKAIQLHQSLHYTHPNLYDSLINASGESIVDDTVVLPFDDADAARIREALSKAGIRSSVELVDSADQAPPWRINTFAAHAEPAVPFDLTLATDAAKVVVLEDHAEEDLGLPLSVLQSGATSDVYAYVAFGVGSLNTAVGRTMADAPVHPPSVGGLDPTRAYSRYIAIYAIPQEGPARLATIAAMHGDHLESLGKHLEEYYEQVAQ